MEYSKKPCKRGHTSERYASGYCIACSKQRHEEKWDEIAEKKKIYHQKNKKKFQEKNKQWALNNPEKYRIMRKGIEGRHAPKHKIWLEKNSDKLAKYHGEYYLKNKATFNAKNAEWKRQNKDKVTAYSQKRRALELGAAGEFSADDIQRLFSEQNGECMYCRIHLERYTVDHIIPLARGGSNWPNNLQLLCRSCNSRKGTKLPEEFLVRISV